MGVSAAAFGLGTGGGVDPGGGASRAAPAAPRPSRLLSSSSGSAGSTFAAPTTTQQPLVLHMLALGWLTGLAGWALGSPRRCRAASRGSGLPSCTPRVLLPGRAAVVGGGLRAADWWPSAMSSGGGGFAGNVLRNVLRSPSCQHGATRTRPCSKSQHGICISASDAESGDGRDSRAWVASGPSQALVTSAGGVGAQQPRNHLPGMDAWTGERVPRDGHFAKGWRSSAWLQQLQCSLLHAPPDRPRPNRPHTPGRSSRQDASRST